MVCSNPRSHMHESTAVSPWPTTSLNVNMGRTRSRSLNQMVKDLTLWCLTVEHISNLDNVEDNRPSCHQVKNPCGWFEEVYMYWSLDLGATRFFFIAWGKPSWPTCFEQYHRWGILIIPPRPSDSAWLSVANRLTTPVFCTCSPLLISPHMVILA